MDTETHAALSRIGLRRDALALEVIAWVLVAALGAMVTLVLLSTPSGGVTSQLNALAEDSLLYRISFVVASLVNPLMFAALALFSWLEHRRRSLRPVELIGWGFLVAYLPLVMVAYVSQFTVFPALLDGDRAAATLWYFNADASIPFSIDILGYGMFGLGAVLLSTVLIRRHGLVGWTGIVLMLSGLASVVGMVGLATEIDLLLWGTTIGGALVVPLAVLLALDGRRCRRS